MGLFWLRLAPPHIPFSPREGDQQMVVHEFMGDAGQLLERCHDPFRALRELASSFDQALQTTLVDGALLEVDGPTDQRGLPGLIVRRHGVITMLPARPRPRAGGHQ